MKRTLICLSVVAMIALVTSANAGVIINVNMYATNGGWAGVQQDANTLAGPAGGLGEAWNQFNAKTGSNLLDSTGAITDVGFSNNIGTGWGWGSPELSLIQCGKAHFGKGADTKHTITGLIPGDLYNLWIASYAHNTTLGERALGEWSTTNPTTTVGSQMIDCRNDPNGASGLNGDTWEYGVNYVLFENVEADPNGEIFLLGDAADGTVDEPEYGEIYPTRLPLSGWQIEEASEPVLVGDTNEDGVVDAADYIAVKTNFGMASGATLADGDIADGANGSGQDGVVDWYDLKLLQDNYSAGDEANPVPEPATLGLLGLGALAVLRRRRA